MSETVGSRVRAKRDEHGWSQRELGQRAGLGYQAISDIETGRKKPQVESLQRLADALGTTVAFLLGETSQAAAR